MKSFLLLLATLGGLGLVVGFGSFSTQEGMPTKEPRPETKALEAWVGTWTADVDVGGQKSTGTEVCRLDLGGAWLISDFKGAIMGSPFQGHSLIGFDPAKEKYVSVWIDSMTPGLSVSEGTLSADGKTMTLASGDTDVAGNRPKYELVTVFNDAETRVFKLGEVMPDGTKVYGMTITYAKKR